MMSSASDSGVVAVEAYFHYYVAPRFLDHTRELARKFNESHPTHQVNIHGWSHLVQPRQVYRAAQEGRPPAIAQFFYTSTQLARDLLAKDGSPLFTSIEKATAGRSEILGVPVVHGDVIPAVREYYTHDGELTSVPTHASTALLYANTTMLQAAGVPSVPETWDEIYAACKAVDALQDGPAYGITWPNHGWMFQQMVGQQGGLLADHENGRSGRAETIDLRSEQMMAYVWWWLRLHRDGYYLHTSPRPAGNNSIRIWEDNFAAFAQQKVALCMSSSVDAERLVQAGRDGGFSVQAAPTPHSGAVPRQGSAIGGDSLWLANGLDEATRDGALAFIEYLNNPRNAAERHKLTGWIPTTRASVDLLSEDGWFTERPYRRVAVDELASTPGLSPVQGALLGNFAGIQDAMVAAMHDVLAEDADPVARFTEANARAQRLLDDYNAHALGTAPGPRGPNCFDVS